LPNWCSNQVTVTGSPEGVAVVVAAVRGTDEDGNHITKNFFLDHVPSDGEIWALARRWHASRTVLVTPTGRRWRVVWVGDEVKLGLDAPWWPLV
jgi:hypothetical protein